MKMRLRSNESIDGALRRFKKLLERSGIKKDMRRKRYYEKPSESRRRADRKRRKKIRQSQAEMH